MKAKTWYTAEQLVRIYDLRMLSYKHAEINKELGFRKGAVLTNVLKSLEKLRHGEKMGRKYKTYIEAGKIIRQKYPPIGAHTNGQAKVVVEAPAVPENASLDQFRTLESAHDNFMRAVEGFIDSVVGEVRRENEELKRAIGDDKMSNWVKNLKNKYENIG